MVDLLSGLTFCNHIRNIEPYFLIWRLSLLENLSIATHPYVCKKNKYKFCIILKVVRRHLILSNIDMTMKVRWTSVSNNLYKRVCKVFSLKQLLNKRWNKQPWICWKLSMQRHNNNQKLNAKGWTIWIARNSNTTKCNV